MSLGLFSLKLFCGARENDIELVLKEYQGVVCFEVSGLKIYSNTSTAPDNMRIHRESVFFQDPQNRIGRIQICLWEIFLL